ncbi:hypothetical protein SRB17_55200 [Streptomyces sp. RB17]|nr:hypothetical protein [Streptomyces sp. RB17]
MLPSTAYGDSRLSMWLRVRTYAVPPSMIELATARRAAGDWAGACAAARIDVDLDLRSVARAHGRDLAARLRADLRRLAPDLLRWHMPRIAPDGLLRPGLTLTLARYERPGRAGPLHLVARTPPAWADAGQRISLALFDPADGPAGRHPHPHPNRRYRLDLHRHLWDASRAGELRDRSGAGGPAPPDRDPLGLAPPGHGCAVGRWAAEASILLHAEGQPGGMFTVRLGSHRRLLLTVTSDAADTPDPAERRHGVGRGDRPPSSVEHRGGVGRGDRPPGSVEHRGGGGLGEWPPGSVEHRGGGGLGEWPAGSVEHRSGDDPAPRPPYPAQHQHRANPAQQPPEPPEHQREGDQAQQPPGSVEHRSRDDPAPRPPHPAQHQHRANPAQQPPEPPEHQREGDQAQQPPEPPEHQRGGGAAERPPGPAGPRSHGPPHHGAGEGAAPKPAENLRWAVPAENRGGAVPAENRRGVSPADGAAGPGGGALQVSGLVGEPRLRIVDALPPGGLSAVPVLPEAATWVAPDLELLRAGLLGAELLHPLVAAALVPGHAAPGAVRDQDPVEQARRVECRGATHRIGLVDGVLVPLDHDPDVIEREELLSALGGPALPCLRVIDEAHRRPDCLAGVRERLDHGDTEGALAVVEALLGPGALLREGPLRDELTAAAERRIAYGLYRAGLTGPGGSSTHPGRRTGRSRRPTRRQTRYGTFF